MRRVRVIPVLLLQNEAVVKSVRFKNHAYVGDPINAVKILNEKEIDELVILDINASREKRPPHIRVIREIASEAFIPLTYGGGISTVDQVKELFYIGVEKVVFNTAAIRNPRLIYESAKLVGSQSVVVSIDVKKDWLGKYKVFGLNGTDNSGLDPSVFARKMTDDGCGEIFLNSIDRDGTYSGFETPLIKNVSSSITVPLVACGGAGSLKDFKNAIDNGASAVAAGSYFIFQRPHRAVLITYPSQEELNKELFSIL